MNTQFKIRHDHVVAALNGLPGFTCLAGQGAFYAFPDCSGAIAAIPEVTDDTGLAEYLIEKAGVALVPGTAFGAPGYIRVSFATDLETLDKAIGRMAEVLAG